MSASVPRPRSAIRDPQVASAAGAAIAVRAPRLSEAAGPWLNGPPVRGWRRAVTLVDFWTYSCVNCLRTLPALRTWHARYHAAGLTVLGVHTPEFPFERERANVARALRDLGVTYPVVLDNDRAIWGRFANRHWPHRYLIDTAGYIRHDHIGEGGEAATERAIRAVLAEAYPGVPLPSPILDAVAPGDGDATVGDACAPATPELFAGYYRGRSGNPGGFREDEPALYTDLGGYREGYIHLQGRWRVTADAAHFLGPGSGHLRVACRGAAVNAVLAPGPNRAPLALRVGRAGLPASENGPPIAPGPPVEDRDLTVDSPRLYELLTNPATAGDLAVLTLTPEAPGLAVYSFTFSSRC